MGSPAEVASTIEAAAIEQAAAQSDQKRLSTFRGSAAEELVQNALLLGGQAQAFAYLETFGRVATIMKLKQIKDTGAYKGCGDGTWASFCASLGFTCRKIDIDITNLETFGSDFLESANRLGLGYRDLAALRALPEDARLQITDGRVVNLEKASKADIRQLIEDMAVQNSTQTRRLSEELTETNRQLGKAKKGLETAEAQEKQLKTRIKTLETGLGEVEEEALKRLEGIKKTFTGGVNIIRASDPMLGPVVGAQIQATLTYISDLARLAALEVGLNFTDGTSPAEVQAAQAEFDAQWGDGREQS